MLNVRQLSMEELRDRVRALVTRGSIGRQERVYELSRYFRHQEWPRIESLLADHDYLLRDYVIDLVGPEIWLND